MSDDMPENFGEYVTEDGPQSPSRDASELQEAHGGSMAPSVVNDRGDLVGDVPPEDGDQEIAG